MAGDSSVLFYRDFPCDKTIGSTLYKAWTYVKSDPSTNTQTYYRQNDNAQVFTDLYVYDETKVTMTPYYMQSIERKGNDYDIIYGIKDSVTDNPHTDKNNIRKFVYYHSDTDVSLGIDTAINSKIIKTPGESLSILMADDIWRGLPACTVDFQHTDTAGDSNFLRAPEHDVKDSNAVHERNGSTSGTTMRAFTQTQVAQSDASTMYMKHADVVSGIVGNSVSKGGDSTGELYDSSVYRKVGNDFYPWWVKLTYHYKNNPTITSWNDEILVSGISDTSTSLAKLSKSESGKPSLPVIGTGNDATVGSVEGYDFVRWVSDTKQSDTAYVAGQLSKNLDLYAVYDIQKIDLNASPNHVSQKQNNQVVTQINYGSTIDIIASVVNGKYISSMLIDDTEQITDTQTDEKKVQLTTVKKAPVIEISYTDDVYKLSKGTYSNGSMTFANNVSTIGYNLTVDVTFKPDTDYYLKSVSVTNGAGTVSDLTISGQQTKLITSSTDLKNGSEITVTPTFDLFQYKLKVTVTDSTISVQENNVPNNTVTSGNSITCGTTYKMTTNPNTGYHITKYQINGGTEVQGSASNVTFTPTITSDTTGKTSGVTEYELKSTAEKNKHKLRFSATNSGSVAVKTGPSYSTPLSQDASLAYQDTFKVFTTDTIKIHATETSVTVGGDTLPADSQGVYTIGEQDHNTDVNVSVTYEANTYPLKINYGTDGLDKTGGTVTVSSSDSITNGVTYTMNISPTQATKSGSSEKEDSYSFSVSSSGLTITDNNTKFTPTNANHNTEKSLTVTFSPITHKAQAVSSLPTGIEHIYIGATGTSTSSDIQVGEQFVFTAWPQTGYYINSIYGGSYESGKIEFGQNDDVSKTSGNIQMWTSNITVGDDTYYVTAIKKKYTVTFDFGGIRENVEVEVAYGKSADAPSDVEVEGYTFEGWDGEFENVTSDNVVYAKYEAVTLDIQWVSSVAKVQYTYSGTTDATYGFEFTAKGYAHSYYVKDLKAGVSRENVYVKEADGTVKRMDTLYNYLLIGLFDTPVYRLPELDTETTFGYLNKEDGLATYDDSTSLLKEL